MIMAVRTSCYLSLVRSSRKCMAYVMREFQSRSQPTSLSINFAADGDILTDIRRNLT